MAAVRDLPKRVLVTGATGAIGASIVHALAFAGVRVAASGRDSAKLETLAGDRVIPIVADLTLSDARENLVARAAERLGGLDGLVTAAGFIAYQAVFGLTEEALYKQWLLNTLAPTVLAQDAARLMRAYGRGGSILHVASSLALRSAPNTLGYASSKAALVASTKSMALELAPDRIRVNAVLPGLLETPLTRQPRLAPDEAAPSGEELEARITADLEAGRRAHPLGRLGTPDEVASTVRHVLAAPWMTGSIVSVDGGVTL